MPFVSEEAFQVQQWLLMEGRENGNVMTLLKHLIPRLKEHNVPVDRLLVTTYLIHAQLGAVQYKYEDPDRYIETPVDKAKFHKLIRMCGSDAPFYQLHHRLAERVRTRRGDTHIPSDVQRLFTDDDYQDMYAMPVFHRGE